MSDTTKRLHIDKYRNPDGSTICYIAPDGCWYGFDEKTWDEAAISFIQRGILKFCGCGMPGSNLAYIRDRMRALKKRHDENQFAFEKLHGYNADRWQKNTDAIYALFPDQQSAYFFFYWMDSVGLEEHGGSVPGWLTDKGVELLEDLEELTRRGVLPDNQPEEK